MGFRALGRGTNVYAKEANERVSPCQPPAANPGEGIRFTAGNSPRVVNVTGNPAPEELLCRIVRLFPTSETLVRLALLVASHAALRFKCRLADR